MKNLIVILLSAFAVMGGFCSCNSYKSSGDTARKVKKGVFVMSEKDSTFDILATDVYDSISFSMRMFEGVQWDITLKETAVNEGEERSYETSYMGANDLKYCFHREGFEDSDTLYGWKVNLLKGNSILLNNEGNRLKVFGKEYGEKVTLFTPDDKMIAEKAVDKTTLEFQIPAGVELIKVDVAQNGGVHVVFNYPMR